MFNTRAKNRRPMQRPQPMQRTVRPGMPGPAARASGSHGAVHPFTRTEENARLYIYERRVKNAFDHIETSLRRISALQHENDFVGRAQAIAADELGFELPAALLADTWIKPLDIGRLYAWCVFETFRRMSEEFFGEKPLADADDAQFQSFLEQCGFHTLDVSPCADGRLAHVIRYVLRLPYKAVRRKSYAGAMFDVDDSLQKWVETEMLRHREGRPNQADAPTRYLKLAVYHHSSSQPATEGCAAHGSDTQRAAQAAVERLEDFRRGVENSFCCGASIDLLLIGIDTDNDVIRVHLPDAAGKLRVDQYIDAVALYDVTRKADGANAEAVIAAYIEGHCAQNGGTLPSVGIRRLAARLLCANLSQIDYVRQYHDGCYRDIGHQERFIGMGIGFEEVQLRNLTYFAYLTTVEEGAKDMDVGIKIFSGLNVSRGLPIPVVIRSDYHGPVPGARTRAEARCRQLDQALRSRFRELAERGLLHTLLMVRDCHGDGLCETVGSSVIVQQREEH
ncbi:MAG: carboxysome shell carbonic anhydrase [Pseudomonadota bacterium]